jgi:hypothetical protein
MERRNHMKPTYRMLYLSHAFYTAVLTPFAGAPLCITIIFFWPWLVTSVIAWALAVKKGFDDEAIEAGDYQAIENINNFGYPKFKDISFDDPPPPPPLSPYRGGFLGERDAK